MILRRLSRDRRGNVLILTAAIAIVLIGSVGLAVDATRAWMVRSRLATALDAAALVAARSYSTTLTVAQKAQVEVDACNVFWANFGRAATNPCLGAGGAIDRTTFTAGYIGASAQNPVLAESSSVLTLSANARLNTTFMRVLGINSLPTFNAAAAATRVVASLEVALALDVTGSMSPIPSGGSETKIQSLRTAGQSFIDTIFNGAETRERLWVSVVPYTTHVNLGNSAYARNMVTAASRNLFLPGGLPLVDTRGNQVPWPGCVEVRYQGMGGTTGDLTDTPPTTDATRYRAWFYPSSLETTPSVRSLYYRTSGGTRLGDVAGDNEWTSYVVGNTSVNNRAINEWALNQSTARGADVVTGGAAMNPLDITGPNLGCLLHSRYAILPLTAERTTINGRIQGLYPDPWLYHMWNTGTSAVWLGGTSVHVGLHAAWTTISPNWQGLWSDTPQTVPLPLATANAGIKAIVLMTDGVNTLGDISARISGSDVSRGAPATCGDNNVRAPRHPVGCPTNGNASYTTTTGYGPYGRWSVGNLVVTSNGTPTATPITAASSATAELDRRLARLCTVIKAAGIELYVVGFDIASAGGNTTTVRALLSACANSTSDYYDAANATALNNAFVSIANRVARVRLVR
jgi:Flp pilus assembly protein TadG